MRRAWLRARSLVLLGLRTFCTNGKRYGYDPVICEPQMIGRTENKCNATGANVTDGCSKLFVDVGANTGQSLSWWYQATDSGRGATEYAQIEPWRERRLYCADVFEASPSFTMTLRQEVENHRSRGRNIRLYEATPFSLEGGNVTFESLGFMNNAGGSIVRSAASKVQLNTQNTTQKIAAAWEREPSPCDNFKSADWCTPRIGHCREEYVAERCRTTCNNCSAGTSQPRTNHTNVPLLKPASPLGSTMVHLMSMNAIEYLRSLVSVDVETFEFELVRGLIASGVLCDLRRKTDVLIEWHVPRGPFYDGSYHHLFDEREYKLPGADEHNTSAFTTREALLWMLRSPVCRTTRAWAWW